MKSQAKLSVVKQSPKSPRKRAPKTTARKARLAIVKAGGGAILGGFIPLAAHTMSHSEGSLVTYAVTAACLLYSAPSLYEWISTALADKDGNPAKLKAVGFVFCLEAILVASPVQWLSWSALVLLAGLNAAILGNKLSTR